MLFCLALDSLREIGEVIRETTSFLLGFKGCGFESLREAIQVVGTFELLF